MASLFGRRVGASLLPRSRWTLQRCMGFIRSEPTPNPDSVMFISDEHDVLGGRNGTRRFSNKYETEDSPLAQAIFKVRGVSEVMLAAKHVTVTKTPNADWALIQPNLELVMEQFYAAGLSPMKPGVLEKEQRQASLKDFAPDSIEAKIIELLEERIRPFVQQDGGDVEFHRWDPEEGIVYLRMQGACSGCPKSSVTLNHGIKNLMEHYIPEVQDVEAVEDDE
eukprot:TRINITY_DN98289_c0_g1_i1.p1 TRINITY_DN98289_c0_g1~~TRINITY_DN98289_c0_g1_i1.p1  ORF type:complete len:237 (+),score=38.83 TRINITY_DN98289_c0_g1_i1:48-713(+)